MDILKIKWPHLVDVPMPVVQSTMSKILNSLELFKVTKLLIDTKDTHTNIPEEDFRKLSKEFIDILASTNLKKACQNNLC